MSGKYLDPKADLTFKLVFGEHPDLVMCLLNALLPLDNDGQITSVKKMAVLWLRFLTEISGSTEDAPAELLIKV